MRIVFGVIAAAIRAVTTVQGVEERVKKAGAGIRGTSIEGLEQFDLLWIDQGERKIEVKSALATTIFCRHRGTSSIDTLEDGVSPIWDVTCKLREERIEVFLVVDVAGLEDAQFVPLGSCAGSWHTIEGSDASRGYRRPALGEIRSIRDSIRDRRMGNGP